MGTDERRASRSLTARCIGTSGDNAPSCGSDLEGEDPLENAGDDPPGLQGKKPDVAKEPVELAIGAFREGELGEEAVHRLPDRLGDLVEGADRRWVGATLILAQEVGPKKGPPGDLPLGHRKAEADFAKALSKGLVEPFCWLEAVSS
ncbi:MAG TPA: hypothetical protein VGH73_17815 [Thermoanaerobaculia bacterium]